MKTKQWIITDTHFNHDNIIEYEIRPENFNELIIENWKSLVSDKDIIYHLGDVIFKRQGTLGEILEQLPGRKILLRGNHDMNKTQWYINKGFESVQNYLITLDGFLLSHHPMNFSEIDSEIEIKYNIHGHFHRKNRDEIDRSAEGYPFYSEKHLLLSIEEENYKPVLIDEFIKRKTT